MSNVEENAISTEAHAEVERNERLTRPGSGRAPVVTEQVGDAARPGAQADAEAGGGSAEQIRRVSRHEPDPEDWEIMRRMVTLDKTLTSPGRLAVLAALWRAGDLDYVYLQKMAGSTQGNLATHCRKLEDAGLLESRKRFVHRKANTRLFITEAGKEAISEYVEGLRSLMERVQGWRPAIDDYREFYAEGGDEQPPANTGA